MRDQPRPHGGHARAVRHALVPEQSAQHVGPVVRAEHELAPRCGGRERDAPRGGVEHRHDRQRDRARGRYQLTRTTIRGADNNPFKWAPSQRLAIDLLLAGSSGFLSGPAALGASFRDLKRHLVATFAGLQGSLRSAVQAFDPVAIEAATAGRASLLKGRAAVQLEEAERRHADLKRQLDDGVEGSLNRAFVAAYDATDRTAAHEGPRM